MNRELIRKTEVFLKETFEASDYLQAYPFWKNYRLEHSYRVANIAKYIAEKEGFNVTHAVIAGLLHDIAYCEEIVSDEERMNHGRRGAEIARPFLVELGLSPDAVNDICYGIAIHVDGTSSFEWERSPFRETVRDADNIDRFDVYRIYDSLRWQKFNELFLAEKIEKVSTTLEKLNRLKNMNLGTATAKKIWLQRLDFYIEFYEKLKVQFDNSSNIL